MYVYRDAVPFILTSLMRPFTLLLALFFVVCTHLPAHAQQVATERKQSFDYDWKFARGYHDGAATADFDDEAWQTLSVPHDWSIEGHIDPEHPSGNAGGYFPTGLGWYRKTFEVPVSWEGKKVGIHFGGVYMKAEVFVNGVSLGVRPYGYSPFRYDLTPHLKYGEQNLIAVRVNNSEQQNSRWYSGSGIYRHVRLSVKEPVHVAHQGVVITTPAVSHEEATVQVKTQVSNETASAQRVAVTAQLTDGDGHDVGAGTRRITLPAHTRREVAQRVTVDDPARWSPQTPHLYQADVQVRRGDTPLDRVKASFGIRSIAYSPETGFQLNGERLIINGGNVHHDNGALGAKAYDRAEERRVELLKEAGFNAVRTAHNPPSEAFLEACDRLGLLVMDESFDGWREQKTTYDYATYFDNWWAEDVSAMVRRDRNHPSVVMWSIGNEIIERTDPEAVRTARALAGTVRDLDPTRPVTSGMTTWDQGWERFDPLFAAHDIGGYNYQLHRAGSDHERVPDRVIVQTESYPREAFENWQIVQAHDYVIGDFVWTAMDYLGESGIGRYYYPGESDAEHYEGDLYPWHGAYCGDIDLVGWRKPISHYRSMLYNGEEKLYVAVREPSPDEGAIGLTRWAVWPTWESWTWPGHEGDTVDVEVYSKHPAVRLYQDGRLVGEQATTEAEAFKATFAVPYAPGRLKAVGVEEGQEVGAVTLETADEAAGIALHPDRTQLAADAQDLSFVIVEVTDEEGRRQPQAEHRLTFEVDGPGVIEAVDNANLSDTDPYVGTTRKAWNGRALVVIRSTREGGTIRLTASAPDLSAAGATIETIE